MQQFSRKNLNFYYTISSLRPYDTEYNFMIQM